MLEELNKIKELNSITDNKIFYSAFFSKENLAKLFNELKYNETLSFNQLIDITAIDYPSKEQRFELVYILLSMKQNKRIVLKTHLDENDNIDSLTEIYQDFPLTGHTEVRYDDVEKKVVYEPVKLAQEYRDFDYTSPWEGMTKGIDDHSEQE